MVTKKVKAVVVLSTMYDSNTVGDDTKKPSQIMDYNFTNGGIDTVNLMCLRISTSKRKQRWLMVVFLSTT